MKKMFFEESYQEFAARNGESPGVWRALAAMRYSEIKDVPVRSEFGSDEAYKKARAAYDAARA